MMCYEMNWKAFVCILLYVLCVWVRYYGPAFHVTCFAALVLERGARAA